MAMKRVCFTMSDEDIEHFDEGRAAMEMSRSAFIRYLISEHEGSVPSFLIYKEVIAMMSELNTLTKQLLIKEGIPAEDKLKICEEYKKLSDFLSKKII